MIFKKLKSAMINDKTAREINVLLRQLSKKARDRSAKDFKRILRQSGVVWIVALDGKTIVGMAMIYLRETPLVKAGIIECVVTDQAYEGKGIGRTIHNLLFEKARKINANYVELTSRPERKRANAFYKKLGFKKPKTNYLRLYL